MSTSLINGDKDMEEIEPFGFWYIDTGSFLFDSARQWWALLLLVMVKISSLHILHRKPFVDLLVIVGRQILVSEIIYGNSTGVAIIGCL